MTPRKIEFTKTVAGGNDFVVIKSSLRPPASGLRSLAKEICDRKFGAGADGLLVLEKSKRADVKMRIFNADGSEAEMCGNGARCAALYHSLRSRPSGRGALMLNIETKAGIIVAKVLGENVKIKLTEPRGYQPQVAVEINGRELKVYSINTGVPHAVIFVEGIEHIDVSNIGRQIRYYECFAPAGTNVDFVEAVDSDTIKVRTYERGVEDETLACGTGAAASAVVYGLQSDASGRKNKMNVITRGGETLKVYFDRDSDKISTVWLEGKVKITYSGVFYV
ncbi:diaminopimelate epimerase [bacterium]|nr:MAG: diaminopimelate epimerase [bacterium]